MKQIENPQDIKRLHWDTLCGVPLNESLKKFWRPSADPQQLMQLPHRQRLGQTVFYTILRPYQLAGLRGKLALRLNERQQRDARESRRDEVLHAQKLLAQGKSIKPGIPWRHRWQLRSDDGASRHGRRSELRFRETSTQPRGCSPGEGGLRSTRRAELLGLPLRRLFRKLRR